MLKHLLAFTLVCLQPAVCHLSFDPFALKLIHDKSEKKIDSNYYLYDKSASQMNPNECTSSDGPYCLFVNGESINDRVAYSNEEYQKASQSALGNLIQANAMDVIKQSKKMINSGTDLLFYENRREILDELLYPELFFRKTTFIFTFETFEMGRTERAVNRTVNYDVDASRFNVFLHPYLNKDVELDVSVVGVFIPPKDATPILDVGLRTVKKFVNSFGFLPSDLEVEEIRFGKNLPQSNYVYTKDDSIGNFASPQATSTTPM